MKFVSLTSMVLIILLCSCSEILDPFIEGTYGPIGEDDNKDHYNYINDTKEIKLGVYLRKSMDLGLCGGYYVQINVVNKYGEYVLIENGYVKLSNILLEEGSATMTYYYSSRIPLYAGKAINLEIKLSNGQIYKETLELPSQTISGFNASSIKNISDSVIANWEKIMPEGNVLLISEAKFSNGTKRKDSIAVADSMYSYTFEESTFTKEPYINDSLDTDSINISLIARWVNIDFSDNFACSSFVDFYDRIKKVVWYK